jgi:tyrosyl-tRNA synthetase
MNLIDDFRARGLLHQITDEDGLRAAFEGGTVTGYIGFDPTAASLHVGSLLQIVNLMRLQRAGHRPIAVVGGGTGLIGDPSGKQAERTLLTRERLDENLAGLRAQLGRFLDFGASSNAALMIDNAAWLGSFALLDFLRDVGKHFTVNDMVRRDTVRDRLTREQGLSYTEFSYMLLQAYDFLALYDRHECVLQLGGSDQWGNIVSGIDLIHRTRGAKSFGLTVPLITTASGEKMGKTERGAIWLDAGLTSPYAFYQYWLQADDADVRRFLAYYTFLSHDDVDAVATEHAGAPQRRVGQRRLAGEVTRLVHGDDGLARAERATRALFGQDDLRSLQGTELAEALMGAPHTELAAETLGTPAASLVSLLATTLYDSKTQARTGVTQGGVSVNDQVEKNPQRVLQREDVLPGGYVILRKGRKQYHAVRILDA